MPPELRTIQRAFKLKNILPFQHTGFSWTGISKSNLKSFMTQPKIKDIKVIFTEPDNIRLVAVKLITDQDGLYGVGCATFTQRPLPVANAIKEYLRPFLIGRKVTDIEDIWQSCYVSSYWRNGPVLNNALSGIDQALWDIKGKMANMPVYDLLGGKSREVAAVYVHASGETTEEVGDKMQAFMEQGFHHIRVQTSTPGYSTYGNKTAKSGIDTKSNRDVSKGPLPITSWIRDYDEDKIYAHPGGIFEPKPYLRSALNLFEYIRDRFGYGVEILHDVHERIPPILGVWFAKEVEKYQLFFLEDLFCPEDNEYFRMVRAQCATPLAMGELYSSPHEIIPMIKDRLIDFIRIHISDMGGITPCRKIAAMGELFTNVLDISLLYPENRRHPMMAMLSGQMTKIIIDVKVTPVPELQQSSSRSEAEFRSYFQHWLNTLWQEKDTRINTLLER